MTHRQLPCLYDKSGTHQLIAVSNVLVGTFTCPMEFPITTIRHSQYSWNVLHLRMRVVGIPILP